MMAAILKYVMLDSDTPILHSDTHFAQKTLTLTLTQSNSIWLKLIHSHLTWWWQPSLILPWIPHLGFSHLSFFIEPTLQTHPLHKKNFTHSSQIQLDDGSINVNSDTAILDFRHSISQIHSKTISLQTLTQTNSIWLKLIHSHLTWWWQPSWILPSWIHPFCTKLWLNLIQSDLNSFILIQLDDGNHLEFCHLGFSHFAKNKLPLFWIQPSLILLCTATTISDTLLSSLRFAQKHSHSTLTLNQTNSIWLKLIHSHLTWWWQPSWILPSWIHPFCTKLWSN